MASNKLSDLYHSAEHFLADMPIAKAIGGVISNPTPQEVGAQISNLGSSASDTLQEATKDPMNAVLNFAPMGMGVINPIRFEAGKRLSKIEREEVMRNIKDAYKELYAPKVEKGFNNDGDPILGYEYNTDYMHKSDVTGKNIRHYITLPDGKMAHPSELFPEITQSKINKFIEEEAIKARAEMANANNTRLQAMGKEIPYDKRMELADKHHISKIADPQKAVYAKSNWESAVINPNGSPGVGKFRLIDMGATPKDIRKIEDGSLSVDDLIKKLSPKAEDYLDK